MDLKFYLINGCISKSTVSRSGIYLGNPCKLKKVGIIALIIPRAPKGALFF